MSLLAFAPILVWRCSFAVGKIMLLSFGVLCSRAKRKLPIPLLALWAWACCSYYWSWCRPWTLTGLINDYTLSIVSVSIYSLIWMRTDKRLVWLARQVAVAVAAIAIIEYPLVGAIEWRSVSTIGSPVHLGAYLAMFVPGAQGVSLAVLLLGVISSGSRSAMLAVVAASMLDRRRWKIAALVAVLGGAVAASRGMNWLKTADSQRLSAWRVAIEEPVSLRGRGLTCFAWVWSDRRRPGAESATINTYAHNDVLEVLTTLGAVGLGLYIWCWCWAARRIPCAELVVLFVLLKFNPPGIEALAAAAILLGAKEAKCGT